MSICISLPRLQASLCFALSLFQFLVPVFLSLCQIPSLAPTSLSLIHTAILIPLFFWLLKSVNICMLLAYILGVCILGAN